MQRTIRTLMVLAVVVGLVALAPTHAEASRRATVGTPWNKDDQVGEASRPQGDVRKITIENGRPRVTFTFRMQAAPVWDTISTSRHTFMRFLIDWQGTPAAFDRRVTVSRADGGWHIVVFDGGGGSLCLNDGGVQALSNHRYRFSAPTGGLYQCLGGAHVLRVAAAFTDDLDPSGSEDLELDNVPNGGGYGPFIRLP